ncbi:VWA domain-containing protein [Panacibacter sp. DH6]|uniref:VWA domain-containing protein n=1 Tax=Panacibacter microcysteis TaxID=2793269 RepID=A0A931GSV5_9BACT|nr:VWA domain-containing protein [Panacibacter microcysteis]MBG9374846.1 VWA domain-containing protein [Panacibacter microcysteis]
MMQRHTSLSANIVQFCRFLRTKNFSLGVEEETAILTALQCINYQNKDVFRVALKTLCCRSRQQLKEFDALFTQYWKELAEAVDAKIKTQQQQSAKSTAKDASFKSLKAWLNGNKSDEQEEVASYSVNENLSKKNFADVTGDEMEELMRTIKALSRRLAAQINRRYEKENRINLPDLRRTLRKNMRRGGELLELAFKKPKQNRTKLVVICDVSRSMELYAAFLLQFMYAFQHVYKRTETFAFSTSLQHITQLLKQHDFTAAMRLLGDKNEGWSGGTRIGKSLSAFVKDYANRYLDKKSIVIIMSDGWDTGDIELLQQSMQTIQYKSKKVIWLNPLAGYADYKPHVAGMKAALPFTTVFAPVHNAESLKSLSKWL